ncbi:MAG: 3-phosphoshikimate 1-carboxyvinyltransferase [Streptococcaceae bacterium]|jgi:3-phosphoshikimate 1-carboxyvinyltransferase|nr:3-phosphoshikimate 1-carboxyvinyltransferase [Streptococcaceae bacterium]
MLVEEKLAIKPTTKRDFGLVMVPGSKSITNRALLLAAMAKGTSKLTGVLFSDDSRGFLECLAGLGYDLAVDESGKSVIVTGGAPLENAEINVRSAGTAARFLPAFLSTQKGTFTMNASQQMMKRPMAPLLNALQTLGATIDFAGKDGYYPFELTGGHLEGGHVQLDASLSSQFLSALLMTGGLYEKGLEIETVGKKLAPAYIELTLQMMRDFGGIVEVSGNSYQIPAGNTYTARDYTIEPDISAACYFYALAALHGGSVTVKGAHLDASQGDIQFLQVLVKMGCEIEETPDGMRLTGPEKLSGINIDMGDMSDQTMTLAAIAPFANSPTRITGIEHIRNQESDRLQAILNELTRLGVTCDYTDGVLTIEPGKPRPCEIETYHDHRMAMSFSLIGTMVPGIVIKDPACVGKTFEDYFETLQEVAY